MTEKRARRKKAPEQPKPVRNRRVRPKKGPAPEAPPEPKRSLRERLRGGAAKAKGWTKRLRGPAEVALRGLVVVAVGVGAVALGRLVERHVRTSPAFAVTEIGLEGHVRLQRAEVLAVAGLAEGRNVFDVSPEEAQAALEAHPWIAEAEVRRRLPGTYTLEIRERQAVALLAVGEVFLVSEDGAVFKRVGPEDPVDLPVITGVDRERFTRDRAFRTSVLLEAVALLGDYRGAGLWRREPIEELHVERDDGLSLYVGQGPTYVRLGHGPFRQKLRRLRTVLDELGERGARAAYVYLDNERRPDRVTVRIREEEGASSLEPSPEPESPAPPTAG
ncbi:MAG: FtsQ-type POTRA domain-containing protein [Myxococcota bacterium]|nr:FtsQ-type POTRA domain-containing protein [Myxococcota bacterium]